MAAGVGGGAEYLLAALGDGAERLARSQQLRASLDAIADSIKDLLLLLRGRSPDDPCAAKVEEVTVERSVEVEADHVARSKASSAIGSGGGGTKRVSPRARGEPHPVERSALTNDLCDTLRRDLGFGGTRDGGLHGGIDHSDTNLSGRASQVELGLALDQAQLRSEIVGFDEAMIG